MPRSDHSPAGVGVITVFTLLMILCLAVFSTLTFSSARADAKLSQARARAISQWYAADAQALDLAEAFAASEDQELQTTVPISESRELFLHLLREANGSVTLLAWQTRGTDSAQPDSVGLDVWDGLR